MRMIFVLHLFLSSSSFFDRFIQIRFDYFICGMETRDCRSFAFAWGKFYGFSSAQMIYDGKDSKLGFLLKLQVQEINQSVCCKFYGRNYKLIYSPGFWQFFPNALKEGFSSQFITHKKMETKNSREGRCPCSDFLSRYIWHQTTQN